MLQDYVEFKEGKDIANAITPPTHYFNIESDSTDYVETDDEPISSTDDEKIVMSCEEKDEVKYLSIFDHNEDDFDEKVMTVENVAALKNTSKQ